MKLKNVDVLQFLKDARQAVASQQQVKIQEKPVNYIDICVGTADYCYYSPSMQNVYYMDSLILRVSRFPLSYLEDSSMTKVWYDVLRKYVMISILESHVDDNSGYMSPVFA